MGLTISDLSFLPGSRVYVRAGLTCTGHFDKLAHNHRLLQVLRFGLCDISAGEHKRCVQADVSISYDMCLLLTAVTSHYTKEFTKTEKCLGCQKLYQVWVQGLGFGAIILGVGGMQAASAD